MPKAKSMRSSRVPRKANPARGDYSIVARPLREVRHRFERTSVAGLGKSIADQGSGFQFTLAGAPNFSDFTALYDRYTISRVDLRFVLNSDPSAAAVGSAFWPTIVFSPDYNDATPPATFNEALERGAAEVLQFSATRSSFTRSIVPRLANTVYRTGVTSAYSEAAPNTLVDIANTDVPFFGAKVWVNSYNSTLTPSANIQVYFRYYLTMVASK